ncbi:hypothetical protein [Sedimentibacter sp.]|uniref:hypothetical protein n=1 Tax=Sedimentibacter sp. TaxID=1960295 RepID=UPI0028AC7E73|nr:hypothetical protein [Sedimentibacter sp.]
MSGNDIKILINTKCPPCSHFMACKIQEGYKKLICNSDIKQNDYDKLKNCLFYRELK